jgi:hypothetical protein
MLNERTCSDLEDFYASGRLEFHARPDQTRELPKFRNASKLT